MSRHSKKNQPIQRLGQAPRNEATTGDASLQELKDHKYARIIFIDDSGLHPLDSKQGLIAYLNELFHRRHFIITEAKSKALSAGRDMFLGRIWLLLQPLLEVLVYILIFGVILKTSRGIENYIGFLVIGVTYFRFFSRGVSGGSGLIQSSRGLISSFKFPRAALAFSVTTRQLIDNIIPATLAVVIAITFQIHDSPLSPTVLLVIPLFLIMHVFILGVTLVVARVTAFIPDTRSLIGLINRALFFTSGIFYSLDRFDGHPLLLNIMKANPVYQFLNAFRDVAIYNAIPSWGSVVIILGATLSLLVFGMVFFWSAEERYAGVS